MSRQASRPGYLAREFAAPGSKDPVAEDVGRLVREAGRLDLTDAFMLAVVAGSKAYAPYSRFHVGAVFAVGEADPPAARYLVPGCNVENASYPIGTCAERDALAAYVLDRDEGEELIALVLVAVNHALTVPTLSPCSPCGACRQAMAEFNPACEVNFFWGDPLRLESRSADELLPAAFLL